MQPHRKWVYPQFVVQKKKTLTLHAHKDERNKRGKTKIISRCKGNIILYNMLEVLWWHEKTFSFLFPTIYIPFPLSHSIFISKFNEFSRLLISQCHFILCYHHFLNRSALWIHAYTIHLKFAFYKADMHTKYFVK